MQRNEIESQLLVYDEIMDMLIFSCRGKATIGKEEYIKYRWFFNWVERKRRKLKIQLSKVKRQSK